MHYILQALFVIIGFISLIASILNWDWFFNAHNLQLIVNNVGRKKARLFYAIIGIMMIATGIFFFLSVQQSIK